MQMEHIFPRVPHFQCNIQLTKAIAPQKPKLLRNPADCNFGARHFGDVLIRSRGLVSLARYDAPLSA